MKAHIVGGGFGGLSAAACLIRNAGVAGADIVIYEAEANPGGGLFLGGNAASGYVLPGSVFDSEFRCTFALLADVPALTSPDSVRDEFFKFNAANPFHDRAHIVDGQGQVVPHAPRFGLSLKDIVDLSILALEPEGLLDGKRIEECFSASFFDTEFWLLWSTLMGSLPQHSAMEFSRYIRRALHLFAHLYDMTNILRTPKNQYESFILPLEAWLMGQGVRIETGAHVTDIGFAPTPGALTVDRLTYEKAGASVPVALAPQDLAFVTTGSPVDDMSNGSPDLAPPPLNKGRSAALWRRLAQGRPAFGDPQVFFDPARAQDSRWVTFTVTTTGREFIDRMTALTGNAPGTGGVVVLRASGWLLSLTIFLQPEVVNQPADTLVWWGYGLHPERNGDFVQKPMTDCSGDEILTEIMRQLKFDAVLPAVLGNSRCVPTNMPYVNNIWAPRTRSDRPQVVPDGATNLGLIGQYVEVDLDIGFTIEYSARTAWEAVQRLTGKGPPPPPVYQGETDPQALLDALKVFLGF